MARWRPRLVKYTDTEPRDATGRWTSGGEPSSDAVAGIRAYTAQGGADASLAANRATPEQTDAMHKWVKQGTADGPIYRGFSMPPDWIVEHLHSDLGDHVIPAFGRFTSFTRDKTRTGTYAGAGPLDNRSVYLTINGSIPGARDISQYSVYPEEQEVLMDGSHDLVVDDATYERGGWHVSAHVAAAKSWRPRLVKEFTPTEPLDQRLRGGVRALAAVPPVAEVLEGRVLGRC